jgi:hypothetical protein
MPWLVSDSSPHTRVLLQHARARLQQAWLAVSPCERAADLSMLINRDQCAVAISRRALAHAYGALPALFSPLPEEEGGEWGEGSDEAGAAAGERRAADAGEDRGRDVGLVWGREPPVMGRMFVNIQRQVKAIVAGMQQDAGTVAAQTAQEELSVQQICWRLRRVGLRESEGANNDKHNLLQRCEDTGVFRVLGLGFRV